MNYIKNNKEIICSVCIATFKRPVMLAELIHSLQEQELPDNVSLEVIIVDNDVEQSAKPVVEKLDCESSLNLNYYVQPEKNISLTRNLAVKNSTGKYLLFIDDDEVASKQWVAKLLKAANEFNADGVFGWVEPKFHDDTPAWMRNRDLYYSPMTETGTVAKYTFTSNCLIKASLIKQIPAPFNPKYGITGGEDVNLFYRLKNEGAKFINCREAVVFETVPFERTRLSYILKRSMRGGNTHTRRIIEEAGKFSFLKRIHMLGKSLVYGTISIILMLVYYPNKVKRIKWMIRVASNIGRFMAVFEWHYKGYK